MALVPFNELMSEAEKGHYAVGYFESWNLESLQAVADAAESTRSPVILGFSGIYLPDPARTRRENLRVYAALGLETCRSLSVPCCLLFNESPYFDWVTEAIEVGFGLVMYTDEEVSVQEQVERVRAIVEKAHPKGVAVEGELTPLPGVGGELFVPPETNSLDDPEVACSFVEQTQVDAFAVNIGQAHVHGRSMVQLNLARLRELRERIAVPLVLHGATSIAQADLKDAIQLGVRKINVGSVLKRSFFEAIRGGCSQVSDGYNPYEVVGSGFEKDVLAHARIAVQKKVEGLMNLFGSARRA